MALQYYVSSHCSCLDGMWQLIGLHLVLGNDNVLLVIGNCLFSFSVSRLFSCAVTAVALTISTSWCIDFLDMFQLFAGWSYLSHLLLVILHKSYNKCKEKAYLHESTIT